MKISSSCWAVFEKSVADYHQHQDVDHPMQNPYSDGSIEHLYYTKNYVDTVQWLLEDIVRDPHIDPVKGIELKRRIDRSNQVRTDLVEKIDDYFMAHFSTVLILPDARLNTESPAWAIDRLSILVLKVWHMREEVERENASETHRLTCSNKLQVLHEQKADLFLAIDELMEDIAAGKKRMKVYRQMKMYNDPSLNPVLYNNKTP
jgi:hypothetical protein